MILEIPTLVGLGHIHHLSGKCTTNSEATSQHHQNIVVWELYLSPTFSVQGPVAQSIVSLTSSLLILVYSWARPATFAAGKGRGGMFLLFLHFHSFSSFSPVPLFHLLYYLFYLSSPFLWETTENDPQGLTCVKPQHKQT